MPLYYSQLNKQSTGVSFVGHTYAAFTIENLNADVAEQVVTALTENVLLDSGGSDVGTNVISSSSGVSVDTDDLKRIVASRDFDPLRSTYKGIRIFTEVGSSVGGWIHVDSSSSKFRPVTISSNEAVFRFITGQRKAFISAIENNRPMLSACIKDRISSNIVLLEDTGILTCITDNRKIPSSLCEMSPDQVLDRMASMSCVYICFLLALCASPVLDCIRTLMDMDKNEHSNNLDCISLPKRITQFYLPFVSYRKSYDRANKLIAYMQYLLKEYRGVDHVSCTDDVSKDEVSFLALKCGFNNVIVDKGLYEQTMSYDLVSGTGTRVGGDHTMLFLQTNKGRPSVHHIGQIASDCTGNRKRSFPMIFLMTMGGNMVKHLDIECNANRAIDYYRNVIMTANPVSMTKAVLDDKGNYKLDVVNNESKQLRHNHAKYNVKHQTIFFDNCVSSAGFKEDIALDINTVEELSDLIESIKERDADFFSEYTSIHIAETAFSMRASDKDVVFDPSKPKPVIVDNVKNRAAGLKFITEMIMKHKKEDVMDIVVGKTELGASKHFMKRAEEVERDRRMDACKSAFSRSIGGTYDASESLFDVHGLSVLPLDSVEKVVVLFGAKKNKTFCSIYGSSRPSDELQRVIVKDTRLHPMFPCVAEILRRGKDVLCDKLTALSIQEQRKELDLNKIKYLKKSIALCRQPLTWAPRDLLRHNFLFLNATYDKINSHLTDRNGCHLSVAGVDVLKKIRIAPALDVLQEKCIDSSSYELCPIPYSVSGTYEDGTSLIDLDVKRQYSSNLMGSGTMQWNRDFFNQLPAIVMERNLFRGGVVRPIISYYSQCCIVNFDPSKVDKKEYLKLDYRFNRDGSTLYGLLGAVNGSRVITSANLINWTMDLWNFKSRGNDYNTFLKFATHFQFDILKIKTGRFVFDEPIRAYLYDHMSTEYKPSKVRKDNGETYYTPLCEIGSQLEVGFKKMFIFPIDRPILKGLVYDEDNKLCIESVNDIAIDLCGNRISYYEYGSSDKVYKHRYSVVYNTIIDSCRVFQLMAKSIVNINDLSQPYENMDCVYESVVEKDATKEVLNTALGKTRQTKKMSITVERRTTLGDTKDDKMVVVDDVTKCDPSKIVCTTAFITLEEMLIETITLKRNMIRNSLEGIRDVVLHLAARQMEKASYALREGSEVCRTKTDGFQVTLEDAPDLIASLKVVTGHKDNGRSNGLPGQCIGMTEGILDSADLHGDEKYKGIYEHTRTNNWKTGVYGMTSDCKNELDDAKWTIYKESEFRVDYHKSIGEPFAHLLCKPYTADELLELVRTPFETDLLKDEVAKFEKGFMKWEANRLVELNQLAISGPPGNGKSFVANNMMKLVAERVERENNKTGETRKVRSAAIGPYHSNKAVFKDHVTNTYTVNAATGHGISLGKIQFSPKPPETSCSFMKPLLWRDTELDYLIMDEVCATTADVEEALFRIPSISRNVILIGDPYQGKPPTGAGLSLVGPTAKYLCNSNMYVKDVPYRNTDPLFNEHLALTRKDGNTDVYLQSGMCEYHDGTSAEDELRKEILHIASGLVKSKVDTALICQSHHTASLCIHHIIRAAVLIKKPLFTLTYVGVCKRVGKKSDDEDEGVDDLNKRIRLYGDTYGKKTMGIVHQQKYYGIPMVFYRGCKYVVKDSFVPGFSLPADIAAKKRADGKVVRELMPRLEKAVQLQYISHSVKSCRFTPRKVYAPRDESKKRKMDADGNPIQNTKKKKKPDKPFDSYHPTLLIKFKNMNTGESYTLTATEVASFLMYPFVSQRCNVIGQTLERVVMVQFAVKDRTMRAPYVNTYEPMKFKLANIQKLYGVHSAIATSCRELQVMASRVKTGARTKVLDVLPPKLETHADITYAALTGATCDGYCARFTVDDRKEAWDRKGEISVFNNNIRELMDLRLLKYVVKGEASGYYNDALIFPSDRMCTDGITNEMFLDDICISPGRIPPVENRKRSISELE